MTIEEYTAVAGSGYSDKDAAIIGPELTRLAESGLSTTDDIVKAAQAKRSPLHPYIYRDDDAEAARKHRVELAGHVARSIKVSVITDDGARHELRAFYPVRLTVTDDGAEHDQEKRPYIAITTIAGRVDLAEQVRADLWRQLVTWRSRARDFDHFFQDIVAAIDAKRQEFEEAA